MTPWKIGGVKLQPGEKKQILICPNVKGYQIPATAIYGQKPGPTLTATAGIHSGEYPGVAALIRLAKDIEPFLLAGKLLLLPSVNMSGFWGQSIDLVPEDGTNLNACYPGSSSGSTGQRIADYFVREIFPDTDFLVDLHSGGRTEPLTPCLFFPAGASPQVSQTSLAAARATNIPYLISSYASRGEYSYAAMAMNIPGLLLERGYCGYCHEEWVEEYAKDVRLILKHLEMLDYEAAEEVCAKTVFEQTIYLTCQEQGLWYPAIKEDQVVEKGQLLGHTEDIWGNALHEYRAESRGRVFYYTSGLAVNEGDPLVAYGVCAGT
ncbi:M14 family metallopeptidase [Desulfitobacterium chlororespirans]|uniref:M14 family metallopeptidase n=1 Tax=Desulfitobacterium chlororespirans TaxID=51616 RepID=UPI0011607A30|nr:M14 family metallopeptidase [Desulfitobacterium chlororespirans]